jgi:predicted RND superfamily exporter protein
VVVVIVCLMIPRPKLAVMTLACIINSIVNVLGFAFYWGEDEKRPHTTISGVSTIYILIACGLAVDYSAHIAHYFNTAKGTAAERVLETLEVIGPSVFHGFLTLMIATVPLSQSVTYVFRTFFKMFFLVGLHGGFHGLFLLPVLLAVFGGDNLEGEEKPRPSTPQKLEVGIAEVAAEIRDDDNESNEAEV